ncbi:MAG: tRNA (guanosine(37)-N1)-methyltransferase TrmD [bacterium]|nr:tRNA (guanosine(37)-N1)-methyltransferase TrmD [bacterium]
MRIDILTLFPEIFRGAFDESIVKRAREKGVVEIHLHNIRDYTHDRHRKADDRPFGGGPGMVLKPEPVFECVESIGAPARSLIYLTPQGQRFSQTKAEELSRRERLVLLCGHYEEIDERIRTVLVGEEISIGDYVLSNGEMPAMVVVDCVVRLIPGVLGDDESAQTESFTSGILDYPQYTRPAEFRGMKVPEILLSGNHQEIRKWREHKALERTQKVRPDLLQGDEDGLT